MTTPKGFKDELRQKILVYDDKELHITAKAFASAILKLVEERVCEHCVCRLNHEQPCSCSNDE